MARGQLCGSGGHGTALGDRGELRRPRGLASASDCMWGLQVHSRGHARARPEQRAITLENARCAHAAMYVCLRWIYKRLSVHCHSCILQGILLCTPTRGAQPCGSPVMCSGCVRLHREPLAGQCPLRKVSCAGCNGKRSFSDTGQEAVTATSAGYSSSPTGLATSATRESGAV